MKLLEYFFAFSLVVNIVVNGGNKNFQKKTNKNFHIFNLIIMPSKLCVRQELNYQLLRMVAITLVYIYANAPLECN